MIQILILVFLASATPAAAQETAALLTREDAQLLSVPDLSRRVLGEVGGLIVDIGRPAWGPPPILPPPLPGLWPPKELPPLQTLVFFGQPRRSQLGMCAQLVIEVNFSYLSKRSPEGTVTGIETEYRYGVTGGPFVRSNDEEEYKRLTEALDESCAKDIGKRDYFPAPDSIVAQHAARVTEALRDMGQSKQKLSFPVTCTFQSSAECPDLHGLLASLDVREIAEVNKEDCVEGGLGYDCFKVVYGAGVSESGLRGTTLSRVSVNLVTYFYLREMKVISAKINHIIAMP